MQPTTAIVQSTATPASDLTLRIGVEAFFRQKRLFLWVAAFVVLMTLAAILLMRKQYLSEMKFLVQNTRENVVVSAERTTSPNIVSDVTEEEVNSQVEILRSHDVIDPVADPGWASLSPSQRTPDMEQQHEKLVATFDRKLDTDITRKTDVIDVSFLAKSPEEARDTLERLSASYLAELRRLQRPAGASEFFASEAERTRQAWDAATNQLVDFQQEHQVVSLPDQEATVNTEITEDDEDLFTTDSALRELDAQLVAASQKLGAVPSRQISEEKVSPNQSLEEELSTLVVEMENKRTDLVTNYKPTDRLVQDLDQQIKTARNALNNAQTSPSKEETTNVDPAWQQIHTSYIQNEIARHATQEHRAKLLSRLGELKQQLATLETLTGQFNDLQAHADELKDNYQLYAQKRDQAQIEDAMDEHKLLNVAVAQQPTLAYEPERPKPLMYGALGFVSAVFLGMCAVYFAETSRSTIATPRELDSASTYPVLATVPQMSWRFGRRCYPGLVAPDGPTSTMTIHSAKNGRNAAI